MPKIVSNVLAPASSNAVVEGFSPARGLAA
jgi:hypothetical protein